MDLELQAHLLAYVNENRRELLLKTIQERTKHVTVILENFFQPHNFSAVLRSCDCFGIQDVHIVENNNHYKTNPKVNMGADKWLSLNRYQENAFNTDVCFETVKAKGYQIIAAHPHTNDVSLYDLDISKPTAIVFGTEKEGISDYVKENADGFMSIPMYGFTESFNVSVAAALTLSHIKHKLMTSDINWKLNQADYYEILDDWLQKSLKGYLPYKQEFYANRA